MGTACSKKSEADESSVTLQKGEESKDPTQPKPEPEAKCEPMPDEKKAPEPVKSEEEAPVKSEMVSVTVAAPAEDTTAAAAALVSSSLEAAECAVNTVTTALESVIAEAETKAAVADAVNEWIDSALSAHEEAHEEANAAPESVPFVRELSRKISGVFTGFLGLSAAPAAEPPTAPRMSLKTSEPAGGSGEGTGLDTPRGSMIDMPTMPDPKATPALIEGYLIKKASGFPYNWLKRYCVFHAENRTLSYYVTEEDYKTMSQKGFKGLKAVVVTPARRPALRPPRPLLCRPVARNPTPCTPPPSLQDTPSRAADVSVTRVGNA